MSTVANTLSSAATASQTAPLAAKPATVTPASAAAKAVTTIAVSKTSQSLNRAAGAPVIMNINDAVDAYQQNPGGFAAVSITDTSTNMQQNMAALAVMADAGKITGITLTDKASLTIDRNLVTGDLSSAGNTNTTSKLLQTVKSAYNLVIKNVTASDALTMKSPKGALIQMRILDSADNITANLSGLLALQTKGNLQSLELKDKSEAITIAAAQLPTYTKFLTSISGGYNLTVNNASVADAAKLQSNANVTSIALSDTGANIAKNIGALSTLVGSGKIDSIRVSDGALKLTAADANSAGNADFFSAQFINGASQGNPVDLAISGASVADVSTIHDLTSNNDSLNLTEQVTDTGAHIDQAKDFLETAVGQGLVSRITVNNTGSNAISFASKDEYTNDLDAVKKLRGAYTLRIDNMSVSNALAFKSENSNAAVQLTINDTADHIAQNFDDIQTLAKAGQIEKINVLEGATTQISISASQFGTGTNAIAALTTAGDFALTVTGAKAKDAARINANPNVASITFNDTGSNIAKYAIAMNALGAKLGKVTVSDGAVTLTSAQVKPGGNSIATAFLSATFDDGNGGAVDMTIQGVSVANAKTIGDLMKANTTLSGQETVSDSASNIEAGLTQLEAGAVAGTITGMKVSDASRITVANMADYNSKHDALDLISGVYNLKISKISLTDSASLNAGASTKLSLGVEDTSANISSGIADLQTLASKGQLLSVKSTDLASKAIAITATQVGANSTALKLLSGTYALRVSDATALQASTWSAASTGFLSKVKTFSVKDNSANVVSKLADLQTIAAAGKLGTVEVSSGKLALTQTQALANQDVLKAAFVNGATQGNPVEVTVEDMTTARMNDIQSSITANASLTLKEKFSDTAAHIKSALDQLETDVSMIASIAVSDNATINSVSYSTYNRDKDALDKLSGNFGLNVSGLSIADVANVSVTGLGKASFSITDTAANISSHLSDLATMLNNGSLNSLTSSDGTLKAITMSAADVSTYSEVLNKIDGPSAGNFALKITDVAANQATTTKNFITALNSAASISAIDVTDTGANIMANVADLQTLAHDNKLGTVSVSDGAFTISETQLTANSDFLASGFDDGASGTVAVTITDVAADKTIDDMAAVTANSSLTVSTEKVKDTADHIKAALDQLQANASKITSITVSDAHTITDVSFATFTRDTDAVNKLSGNFTLNVSGISISDASGLTLPATGKASFSISDTAANIASHLSDLTTMYNNGSLNSLTSSDGTGKAVSVSADDLIANSNVLGMVSGPNAGNFALKITDATSSNALSVKNFVTSLNASADLSGIDVADTGAKIMSHIGDLQTLASAGKLGKVTVSDGTLSISESQLTGNTDFLKANFDDGNGAPVAVTITTVAADKTSDDFAAVMTNGSLKVASEKVNDTADHIESNILALEKGSSNANGGTALISSIAVSDNGTIDISEGDSSLPNAYDPTDAGDTEATKQYTDALKLLSGSYGMSVSGIAVAHLDAVSSNVATNPLMRLSFTVKDSASNLSTAFDDLQTKASAGKIDSINIDPADVSGDPITLTAAQGGSDAKAISLLAAGTAVKIDDTAQNILDNIADMKTLKANSGITLIVTPNDSSPPDLTIANMKDIKSVTDSTFGGLGFNIKDNVGNILNEAASDPDGIIAGATAISVTETDPVNLTKAQATLLSSLSNMTMPTYNEV